MARNLLATSFDLIAEIAKESELKRSNVTDDADLLFGRLINVAASHDETLARELTRKRNLILEHSGRSTQQRPASLRQLSALLLSESVKHLKSDRKRAQELFRQSISSYVTQEHFWFLKTIRKESPQTADVFFAEAIDILNQRELREANEVMVLASYLFSPTETVAYDLVGDYNAANSFGNVSLNPSQPVLAKKFRVGWGGIQGHQSPRMIWGDDHEITLTQLVNNHRFTVVNLFDRFCTECPTGERLETMNKLARKQRQDLAIAAVFLPIPRYLI